jgi:hypothetical protein
MRQCHSLILCLAVAFTAIWTLFWSSELGTIDNGTNASILPLVVVSSVIIEHPEAAGNVTSTTKKPKSNTSVNDQQHNNEVLKGNATTKKKPEPESNDENQTTINKKTLNRLHFCQKQSFELPRGKESLVNITVDYYCDGEEYELFAKRLNAFAGDTTLHTETWGRRAFPIPAKKSVLFLGNSHTRQTAIAIICQFADQVEKWTRLSPKAVSVHFKNKASICIVWNSSVEISLDWIARLDRLVRRKLDSWDSIVLGQFNGAGHDLVNTTFYREMMNMSLHDKDLQFGKVTPPDIYKVAAVYSGPILFVSNYNQGKLKSATRVKEAIDGLSRDGRKNAQAILSRKYIGVLGHECASDKKVEVGPCAQKKEAHRCMGKYGAHPDLIAFDVQETLYSLLED